MESITIKEIAKLCGVGISTVSRAMNDHPDINQETKEKVMKVIKDYNYVPNNSARNLKRSDARSIAVLIKGIGNPFFSKMIKIFEREIQKKKYSFVLQHIDDKQNEIDAAIQLEKEKRLNGIVFLGGFFSHSEEKLKQLSIPFVISTVGLIDTIDKKGFSSVSVDDIKESYKMTEYLIKRGHKRIALISACEDDESIGRLRLEGYKKALRKHEIVIEPSLIRPMHDDLDGYTMENGYAVTEELIKSGIEFTAIYAISDSVAIGACRALRDAGKKIPADYSVVGFDGLDIAAYYIPALTTIRQPVEEMAEATIKILFDVIRKKTATQHRIFEAELVQAESVKTIEGSL